MKCILTIAICVSFFIPVSPICFADDLIKGHYCYTYGDKESLMEAKDLTHTLAIRNAIESYRVYIESTATVRNFVLTNDIVQILTSGYLQNIKIIAYKEQGRTICETIQATVSPQEIEKIIKNKTQNSMRQAEEKGIDNNGYLKILKTFVVKDITSVNKTEFEKIRVRVKVLREIKPSDRIIIFLVYYGDNGEEVGSNKKIIDSFLLPGEIRDYDLFYRDKNDKDDDEKKSYKVSLYPP